jgi:hypothetical protein
MSVVQVQASESPAKSQHDAPRLSLPTHQDIFPRSTLVFESALLQQVSACNPTEMIAIFQSTYTTAVTIVVLDAASAAADCSLFEELTSLYLGPFRKIRMIVRIRALLERDSNVASTEVAAPCARNGVVTACFGRGGGEERGGEGCEKLHYC